MPVTTRAASPRTASSTQTTPTQLVQAMSKTSSKTQAQSTVNRARNVTKPPSFSVTHAEQDKRKLMDPRWEAPIAAHPPLRRLPAEYCAKSGNTDRPYLMYGWAFDRSHMLEIARRRGLIFQPGPCFRRLLGSSEEVNFGDLTEEHLRDPRICSTLQDHAITQVCGYIRKHTRASFTLEEPLSMRWDVMLVLWNNHDIDEKYRRFRLRGGQLAKVKEFMDELMNECLPPDSERAEPLWWWSLQNEFVVGIH